MNLSLLLLIPLLTALALLPMRDRGAVRWISFVGATLQLALGVALYYFFIHEPGSNPLRFVRQYDLFPSWGISLHFGVDGISVSMILLTAFVVLAGILVSWKIEKMTRELFLLLHLLSLGAYGFFISLDLFVLFFFLELAVIPKYLLIGIWGSGRKEYSANKLALMLMGGSALVLVGILGLYFSGQGEHSFDMLELAAGNMPINNQLVFFPFLFLGFGVFTAIFPFHTWVPDGHSSAPTAGSMFLAGISMKLGGYGCLKVAVYLLPEGAVAYGDVIIILASIAILYGAFATLMQKDLKYMNAYSSVSHCGFVLLGIGMLTKTAFNGAVMQMVSHGLMTALFFCVIGIIYERTHTRQISEMGGLLKRMPFTVTALFIAGLCSLGLPGLSGFVAEMTVFVGSWQREGMFYRVATVAACISIVVTAVYILRAIAQVGMGPLIDKHPEASELKDATWNERLAVVVLIAGILAIGLAPYWLYDLVSPATEIIIEKTGIK
jgi:NADH-quinone oxidoreductase subunit M